MIKVGIIGATGYAGAELVRILANHKEAEIVWYGSRSYIDKKYYQVYRNMFEIVDNIAYLPHHKDLSKRQIASILKNKKDQTGKLLFLSNLVFLLILSIIYFKKATLFPASAIP